MNEPRRKALRTLLLALSLGVAAAAHPRSEAAGGLVTTTLTIDGQVKTPRTFTPEELEASGLAADVPDVPITGSGGEIRRTLQGYRGVRLADLLPASQIAATDHNALKRTYLVATASDGYTAVFSWGELYNSPVGSGVWVLFARAGMPLGEEEGRIALISAADLKTGPRHVKWLKTITVRQI